MVCKSDIVSCFKELESYERIRVMCNLLNLCHPSELRYFGTCLEYLGKRDFHEFRQLENVANSPAEINSLDLQCLNDKTVRKKLVLYLSLLHSNNDTCSNGLFKILSNWSEVDKCFRAHSISEDEETSEEFLMLYVLAANHPAFTVEQKLVLENIFSKLLSEKQRFTEKPGLESPPAYPIPYHQLPKVSTQVASPFTLKCTSLYTFKNLTSRDVDFLKKLIMRINSISFETAIYNRALKNRFLKWNL